MSYHVTCYKTQSKPVCIDVLNTTVQGVCVFLDHSTTKDIIQLVVQLAAELWHFLQGEMYEC